MLRRCYLVLHFAFTFLAFFPGQSSRLLLSPFEELNTHSKKIFKDTLPNFYFNSPYSKSFHSASISLSPFKSDIKTNKLGGHEFIVSVENNFTDEMDQLRKESFPGPLAQMTCRDEFDNISKHVIVKIDGNLAAYMRLTYGSIGLLQTTTKGQAEIPTGKNVIDLGRALIAPPFRGQNSQLYEVVILKGLQWAENNSYECL